MKSIFQCKIQYSCYTINYEAIFDESIYKKLYNRERDYYSHEVEIKKFNRIINHLTKVKQKIINLQIYDKSVEPYINEKLYDSSYINIHEEELIYKLNIHDEKFIPSMNQYYKISHVQCFDNDIIYYKIKDTICCQSSKKSFIKTKNEIIKFIDENIELYSQSLLNFEKSIETYKNMTFPDCFYF